MKLDLGLLEQIKLYKQHNIYFIFNIILLGNTRQLFFRTAALLDHGIEPVYVLEGQAPELKAQTMARRRELQWGSSQIRKPNFE